VFCSRAGECRAPSLTVRSTQIMHESGDEQSRLWNGLAGRAWVDEQPGLDHMYKPIEALLVDAARSESHGRVLDVGCGTGGTTLAVAQQFGTKGACVGIDV